MFRHFFYRNLRDLGDVAVSEEAQDSCTGEGISEETFAKALLQPACQRSDGARRVIREREGIRLVIELIPAGYNVVKNVSRIDA